MLREHQLLTFGEIDSVQTNTTSGSILILYEPEKLRRNAELRFRKATGHSVLDEIHDVQLARAKELLSRHDMPLKLISDFCGFEHPNSLRKFFKAKEGRTMSDFRKAL